MINFNLIHQALAEPTFAWSARLSVAADILADAGEGEHEESIRNALAANNLPAAFYALMKISPKNDNRAREHYADYVASLGTETTNYIADKIRTLTPEMLGDEEQLRNHWSPEEGEESIFEKYGVRSTKFTTQGIPDGIRFSQAQGFISQGKSVLQALSVRNLEIRPGPSRTEITTGGSAGFTARFMARNFGGQRDWAEEFYPQVVKALTEWKELNSVRHLALENLQFRPEELRPIIQSTVLPWDQLSYLSLSDTNLDSEALKRVTSMKNLTEFNAYNSRLNDASMESLLSSDLAKRLRYFYIKNNPDISDHFLNVNAQSAHNPKIIRDTMREYLDERRDFERAGRGL